LELRSLGEMTLDRGIGEHGVALGVDEIDDGCDVPQGAPTL
jgi:hypothetical protein